MADGKPQEESGTDTGNPLDPLREEVRLLFPAAGAIDDQDDDALWKALASLESSDVPHALCLPGGGIRSATFCLGVLQGLARERRLEDFHYLSTVSGGGYLGSWLSRWRAEGDWSQEKMTETARTTTDESVHPIRRLRSFSNYLTPNWGLSADAVTVATIFLRNLMINLLIWVPLVLIAAAIPRIVIAAIRSMALFDGQNPIAWAAFGVPALLAALWLAVNTVAFFVQPPSERDGERWSRKSGWLLAAALGWLLAFALFIYLPQLAVRQVEGWTQSAAKLGVGGGAIAVLTAALGYWSRHGVEIKRQVTGFADKLGARLLDVLAAITLAVIALGASLILSYTIGRALGLEDRLGELLEDRLGELRFLAVLVHAEAWKPLLIGVGILGATLLLVSLRAGANNFSLHALYGNRLIRAYLGSARMSRPATGNDEGYNPDDDIAMSRLVLATAEPDKTGKSDNPVRLFHVVNMTLNLARAAGHRRDWQERRAASFTATPLHCGSPILGYAPTALYGGGEGMMLGRAMTISGAAASPNMGYYGSPLMALVMAFFNVRLGWWVPHPARQIDRSEPRFGLLHMLKEGFSRTSDTAKWLYLSDGGHFDNLGLYEMVRRRCRRIVVLDAGCDGEFTYSDLHNAVRKIGIDFGVPIDLPTSLPGQKGIGERQRVMVGTIRYSALRDGYPDGELFYVKSMLTGAEPPSLINYAQTSRRGGSAFPHHSTLDQFFDETQFESYRRLGEFSAGELLYALDARPVPHVAEPPTANDYYPLAPPIDVPGIDYPARPPRADPEPPVPILRGVGEIAAGLQEMSPVRLLVTTLAAATSVGAAATLGSTVADRAADAVSSPAPVGTIRIDPEDMATLRKGVKLEGVEETRALLDPLLQQMRDLQTALGQVGPGTPGSPGAAGADGQDGTSVSQQQIADILGRIGDIDRRIGSLPLVRYEPGGGGTNTGVNPADIGALTSSVQSLVNQLKQNPPLTRQQMETLLGQIISMLSRIETRLNAIDPRRNARSQ